MKLPASSRYRRPAGRLNRWTPFIGRGCAIILTASIASLLAPHFLEAANAEKDVLIGATDLTSSASYNPATALATTDDITFTSSTYGATTFTVGSSISIGTLNDLDATQSLTITNPAGATTITLNGGSPGNTVSGTSADLLYVATGGNLTIANGAGTLGLVLGATGNLDIAGTGVAAISSIISGSNGLTKTGAGTLTLSGVNSYTGGTNINTGTLTISADSNLGGTGVANGVSLNGGTLNTGSNLITLNANHRITVGANGGTIVNTGTGANFFNFSSTNTLSGSGALQLQGNSGTNDLFQINAAQNISGPISVNNTRLGIANAAATLGTSDILEFNGSSEVYVAAGATLSNRMYLAGSNSDSRGAIRISTGATFSGNIVVNPAASISEDAAITSTFSNAISGGGTVQFGGVTGSNASAIYRLTGNSTVNGLTIGSGTVQLGDGTTTGTLSANTLITNNGTFAINRSNAVVQGTDFAAGITGTGGLTLTGTNTVTLSGTNTFGGATTLAAGNTLVLNSALADAGSTITPGTGTIQFATAAGTAFTVGGLTGSANLAMQNVSGASITLSLGNVTNTYTGVLSNGTSGTANLTKIGSGTFTLGKAATYTGTTTINQGNLFNGLNTTGVLKLDFSNASAPATNLISSSSTLWLGGDNSTNATTILGGGQLNLTGKASTTNSQAFTGNTTVGTGFSQVVLANNATANPLSVNLNAITRQAGGVVDFTLNPNGTNSATNGIVTSSGTASTLLTDANGTAYATVAGNDWAAKDATNAFIVTGTTAAIYTTANSAGTFSGNADITGSFSATSDSTVNTIRFNTGTNLTLTLAGTNTISAGGILFGSGIVDNGAATKVAATLTGGTIQAGPGRELVFTDNKATSAVFITIGSVIADSTSGASSVTYRATNGTSGGGQFLVTGQNGYTGPTYLLSGRVLNNTTNSQPFGNGGNVYIDGNTNAQYYQTAAATVANHFYISGSGWNEGGTSPYGAMRIQAGTISGQVTLLGNATISAQGGTGTFGGVIDDGGNGYGLTINTGTVILTAAETYTGTTTLTNGATLQLGNGTLDGSINNTNVNGPGTASTNTVNFNNVTSSGNLTYTGRLNGVVVTKSTTGTLTLNNANNSLTTLNLNNAGAIIDIGSNNLTLSNNGGSTIQSTTGGTINATGGGTITLSQLSLTDGADIGTANGTTLTINANIIGASAYENWTGTANGTGVTVLTGTNTFIGNVVINGGVLQVASIGNQFSTTSNLGQGTTIQLSSVSNNSSTLKYTGTGETTNRIVNFWLGNANTGGVIEQAGTGLLKFISDLSVTGGNTKTLTLQGSTGGTGEFAGIIGNGSGTVSLTKAGTGTWTLSGANTYTGATTVNASGGTLNITGTLGNTAIAINGGILSLQNASAVSQNTITVGGGTLNETVVNSVGGTASVTVNSGTANLSVANSYNGTTNAAGGTLSLGDKGALGTSAFTFGNGAIQASTDLSGANKITNVITDTASTGTTINGSNNIEFGGVFTQSGSGRTLTISNTGTTTFSGNMFLSELTGTGRTLTITQNGATVVSGNIANFSGGAGTAGNLIVNGSSSLTLSGTNAYSGTTTLSSGTINANSTTAFGASSSVSMNGITLDNTTGAAITLTNNNPISLGGNNIFTGGTGTTHDLNLGTGAVTLTGTRTWTVNAGTLTFGGGISGSGNGLTKSGPGTLALNGSNSYTGATTVNAGTLDFTGGTSTGSTSLFVHGTSATPGVLKIETGASETIAGNISIAQVTGDTNGSLTITGGTLANTGSSSYFTIGDNNTGTGGTAVGAVTQSGGTLNIGTSSTAISYFSVGAANSGAFTLSGTGIVNSYTTLGFNLGDRNGSTGLMTVNTGGALNVLSTDGIFLSKGNSATATSGTLTLGGGAVKTTKLTFGNTGETSTSSAIVNLNGGTLTVGTGGIAKGGAPTNALHFNGGTLASTTGTNFGAFAIAAGIVINVDTGGANVDTTGGSITSSSAFLLGNGLGNLTISGGNALTLPTGNTFTGTTTINGSGTTLKLSAATSLVNSVAIDTGAVFDLNGNSQSIAGLNNSTGSAGFVINSGTAGKTLTLTGSGTYSFGGAYTGGTTTATAGTSTLTVALGSGGVQTLSGANTYTGGTTLTSGTLNINNGASGTSTSSAVGTGTLAINGGTIDSTVSGIVLGTNNAISIGGDFAFGGTNDLNLGTGAVTLTNTGTRIVTLGGSSSTLTMGGQVTASNQAGNTTLTVNGTGNTLLFSSASNFNSNQNNTARTFTVNGSGNVTINGLLTSTTPTASLLAYSGTGKLTLSAGYAYTGTSTIASGGTVQLGNGATAVTMSGGITNSGTLIYNPNAAFTSAAVTGTGAVTIIGGQTVKETTSLSTGLLTLGDSSTTGTLDLNGVAQTVGGLTNGTFTPASNSIVNTGVAAALTIDTTNGSQSFGGVISPATANLISLVKTGSNTETFNGTTASTFTGGIKVNGGTLALNEANVAGTNNLVSSSNALTMGGGTLSVSGGTQTLASLATTANTTSFLTLGANSTLTITSGTQSFGTSSQLTLNTSAGGANGATVGNAIMVWNTGTAGSIISNAFLVTDTGGTGFATKNGSNQIIRLNTTLLPASGAVSTTNYFIDNNTGGTAAAGSNTLTLSASEAANSISVDTTARSGTLDLGSGSFTLSNNNWSFAGANAYTIDPGTGGNLKSVASGNAINFTNAASGLVTINAPILAFGSNAVTFNGTGTTVLAGANTYTGGTTINAGTVKAGVDQIGTTSGALGAGTGALTLNNPSTLDLNGFNVGVGAVAGNSGTTITNNGGSAATLTVGNGNGFVNFTGSVSAGSGGLSITKTGTNTLNFGSTTALGSNINITFTGTGFTQGFSESNIGGTIGNSTNTFIVADGAYINNFTTSGNAGWTLGANVSLGVGSTYGINADQSVSQSGNFTSTDNTAVINWTYGFHSNSPGISGDNSGFLGTVNIGDNGQGGRDALRVNSLTAGSASAIWHFNGNAAWGGNGVRLNGGAGTYKMGEITSTGGAGNIYATTAGSILQLGDNTANVASYSGTIGLNGTGLGITKVGTNTQTLTGANTYTGTTTISAGTLNAGIADTGTGTGATAGALGTGAGNVTFSGGTLQYSAASAGTDYSGRIKSSGSAIKIDANSQSLTYASALASTNTGGLTKSGIGTLTLSGANAYAGTTTVSTGTLKVSGSGTLGSVNNDLVVGATLDLNGTSQGVGALSGSGTIDNVTTGTTNTLTLGNNDATGGSFSGAIQNTTGTLSVTKTGSGTQTLTNTNPYTGATTVSQGELIVSGSLSGTTSVGVSGGATFTANGLVNTAALVTVAGTLQGSGGEVGSVTVSSGGTVAPGVNSTDILHVSGGAFSLLSGAHLAMEINGTAAGVTSGGYDQVSMANAGGTLTLAGDLHGSLLSGYTANSNDATITGGHIDINSGDRFFLVIGASAVNGHFSNVTGTFDGYDTITFDGQLFAVSYSADFGTLGFSVGSGHDVALLAIPEPNAAFSFLSGFGLLLGLQRRRSRTRA